MPEISIFEAGFVEFVKMAGFRMVGSFGAVKLRTN
jgi:hypothetical protein